MATTFAHESRSIDNGLAAFMKLRPRLFGIAYRILGSACAAEDLMQDVWIRWQTADRTVVRDATAFLVATATRLAINVMHSARVRREMSSDQTIERADCRADPAACAERIQAVHKGIALLLQALTPAERAAYILREAFDYAYRDIAALLCIEEANARQIVTRARQHLASGRRMPISARGQQELVDAFVSASRHGDVAALEEVLAFDVLSLQTRAIAA